MKILPMKNTVSDYKPYTRIHNIMLDQKFTFVTISEKRYRHTLREALQFIYFHRQFFYSFVYSILFLILLMPHNYIYDLPWEARSLIWPALYFAYLIIWISLLVLGSFWSRWSNRAYYTPIGLFLACTILTPSFYQLAPLITDIPNHPTGAGIFLEVFLNTILVCILEAIYYYFAIPKTAAAQKFEEQAHEWERI